jgi:CheY-like chemotaxis protein/DNA-directed RNA polymerase specialized sigma24 family protein
MSATDQKKQLSLVVAEMLPFLRRYARALTGSQSAGDRYAATTLEALLQDRTIFDTASSDRVALYAAFHQIWSSLGTPMEEPAEGLEAAAQKHLSGLTPNTREALLLNTIEGFNVGQVAEIMQTDADEVNHLLGVALREMARSATGMVMIIEDEPIIAMQLQAVVEELGHTVTGIARTHAEAVTLAAKQTPDLIMSDIQLADKSSGVDAVNEILQDTDDMPVIFITAFPERLLTGERMEPAFLITKPYTEEEVRSAVSQAMFFSSTATLET